MNLSVCSISGSSQERDLIVGEAYFSCHLRSPAHSDNLSPCTTASPANQLGILDSFISATQVLLASRAKSSKFAHIFDSSRGTETTHKSPMLSHEHIPLEPLRVSSKVAALLVKAGERGLVTPFARTRSSRFWRPGGMRACPAGLPVKAHAPALAIRLLTSGFGRRPERT